LSRTGQTRAWKILPKRESEKDADNEKRIIRTGVELSTKTDDFTDNVDKSGRRVEHLVVAADRQGQSSREWRHSQVHQREGQAAGDNPYFNYNSSKKLDCFIVVHSEKWSSFLEELSFKFVVVVMADGQGASRGSNNGRCRYDLHSLLVTILDTFFLEKS